MTTQTSDQPQTSTTTASTIATNDTAFLPRDRSVNPLARRERRPRDFGVGYGNSSGYASTRRYADNWGNARFHCG